MGESTTSDNLPQATLPPSGSLTRRLALGLLLGFGVLIVLALVGDLRQVSQLVFNFRWSLFSLVLLLTLFNYTLRFFK